MVAAVERNKRARRTERLSEKTFRGPKDGIDVGDPEARVESGDVSRVS